MVRAKTEKGVATHRLLLDGREATLDLGGRVEWALLNEGGHGFFRVHYAADLLAALGRNLGELKAVERYALVSDSWAATVAGMMPLKEFLAMLRAMRGETDLNVWRAMLSPLGYLDMIVNDAERPTLAAAAREIVSGAAARLGWDPRPGEDELVRQLRGTPMGCVGHAGRRRRGATARGRDLRALSQGSGLGGPRPGAGSDRNPGLRGRSAALRRIQATL